MVQAQKGYFKTDGRFVPESLLLKIPAHRTVTIIWETEADNTQPVKTDSQKRYYGLYQHKQRHRYLLEAI